MYTLPNSTLQNAAAYKAAIDESAARNFGVYPNDPADMSVNVAAGAIFNGTTTTAYAAQAVGPITAPVTNPRIDRIILNLTTGVASVLAGSESATPSAPAITSGYISLAQITLATSTTGIDYTLIENEKPISNINNLTSPTINTPVIQGGTIGTTTPMTSAKVTQFNRYNTVTGVSLTSMARLCRIQLNAQADILQARIHLSLSSDHLYGDFVVTARQQAALNNNPVVTIKCISLNQVDDSGATSNRVRYDSLIAVYTLNASYTYVDIYVRNPGNTTLSAKYDFVGYVSSVTGSPSITYYDSEALATPTADVTSYAAKGVGISGTFTTASLAQDAGEEQTITHNLGTNNVFVQIEAINNGSAGNWYVYYVIGTSGNNPDRNILGPAVTAFKTTSFTGGISAGQVGIKAYNGSATSRTITVNYRIIAG